MTQVNQATTYAPSATTLASIADYIKAAKQAKGAESREYGALRKCAESMDGDNVSYFNLIQPKGTKPTEFDLSCIKIAKDFLITRLSDEERAVYLADKKTAKEFDERLVKLRKYAGTRMSDNLHRLASYFSDAPEEVAAPKVNKKLAEKIRVLADSMMKIAQGEQDGSLVDIVGLQDKINAVIKHTFLSTSKNNL